jgi:hypothetical protein
MAKTPSCSILSFEAGRNGPPFSDGCGTGVLLGIHHGSFLDKTVNSW